MTDSRTAVGFDRLPWLTDEPEAAPAARPRTERKIREPRPVRTSGGTRELAGWAVAASLLVAGASYWLGTQSGQRADTGEIAASAPARPEATIKLPEPRLIERQEVPIAAVPQVRPVPVPEVKVAEPRVEKPARRARTVARRKKLSPMDMGENELSKIDRAQSAQTAKTATPVPARVAPVPTGRSQRLALWPSRVSRGAYGRLVQIGAFRTRQQAKLGWRRMIRWYPAVGRLPAVVVEARNSRGRRFYRLQIGTTSQAHSEVLCQRMHYIRYSCAVVGLPWKSKVER